MFTHVYTVLQSLKADRKGIAALEYGILGAIVLAIVATALGTTVSTNITTLMGHIATAVSAP